MRPELLAEKYRVEAITDMLWAKQHDVMVNGVPYADPLAGRDGIKAIFFLPADDVNGRLVDYRKTDLDRLKFGVRKQRDVVATIYFTAPRDWFIRAGINPDHIINNIRSN